MSCSLLESWSQNNCLESHLCRGWCLLAPSCAEPGKAGREAPSLSDAGPFPEPLWNVWALASRAMIIPIRMGSYIPRRAPEHDASLPLQPVGRGVKGTSVLLPLLIWQCLTAPARLCSARGQLSLPCCNLPIRAVDPCRIPSVQILLDFVPSKKSCSGFLELRHISLTQNCCFLGSSDVIKLVWLFFFLFLVIRVK